MGGTSIMRLEYISCDICGMKYSSGSGKYVSNESGHSIENISYFPYNENEKPIEMDVCLNCFKKYVLILKDKDKIK
jgi:hypothetical protein